MIQIPAFLITAGKTLLMKKITEKVSEEFDSVIEDGREKGIVAPSSKTVEKEVYSTGKITSLILLVLGVGLGVAVTKGWISKEVADLILDAAKSQEGQSLIQGGVESIEGVVE